MKSIAAAVLLSLASATTFAAVNDVPPVQAPAGSPAKFEHLGLPSHAASAPVASHQPQTRAEKRAARIALRAERVGPKPIN